MFDILLRAVSFAFIILIGIVLRSAKVVTKDAGRMMKNVMLYVTLPGTIIIGFSGIDKSVVSTGMMLLLMGMGLAASIFMVIVGVILTRRKEQAEQALFIACIPSFNIGAFCVPFISGFIGLAGQAIAYMFDVGNSIMCTGGTYAFLSGYVSRGKTKRSTAIGNIAKKLFTSPPFLTYVCMFLLSICNLHLPERVLTFLSPIKDANTFVAMLMLGLLFRVELKREYLTKVSRILLLRLGFAVSLALLVYFVLPFPLLIRQTLVLVSFGPMSALAPAYTGMCGGDEGLASCAGSLSIILGLVIITALAAAMGLSPH